MTAEVDIQKTEEDCLRQINFKIADGYHLTLGKTPEQYTADFDQIIQQAVLEPTVPQGMLVLVDPRVPFRKQVSLRGVDMDPAVFYIPQHYPSGRPYVAYLEVIGGEHDLIKRGLSPRNVIKHLPVHLRPASPMEGINADIDNILERIFVNMPGGAFIEEDILVKGSSIRTRTLCLEKFLGKSRITHKYLDEFDGLIGMLVAYR